MVRVEVTGTPVGARDDVFDVVLANLGSPLVLELAGALVATPARDGWRGLVLASGPQAARG